MTATQATEQVKETAQQAAGQARSRVRDEVDRRSTEAGEQATSVADAIRRSAEQLREQGKDTAAKPMDQAAERVERAGSWLRESDGDRILRDVEDFGRRKPMAVIAGGLAVGFALSRLLKASSSSRYEESRGNGAGLPRAGTTSGPYGEPSYGDRAVPEPPAAVPPGPPTAPSPAVPPGPPSSATPPAHMPRSRPDRPGGL